MLLLSITTHVDDPLHNANKQLRPLYIIIFAVDYLLLTILRRSKRKNQYVIVYTVEIPTAKVILYLLIVGYEHYEVIVTKNS